MIIKRIILTGPECSGKTTLAKKLAEYYNTIWVPEYARSYINNLKRAYNYQDIELIAKQQIKEQVSPPNIKKAKRFIFYDTDLIITKIWFLVVFKKVPEWVNIALNKQRACFHLLCEPDIRWHQDGVRENGSQEAREYLFSLYKKELISFGNNFAIINGFLGKRLQNAIDILLTRGSSSLH